MLYTPASVPRQVLEKYGGQPGDVVGFADEGPLSVISQASLDDLNNRLEVPITMNRFRPNIVLTGSQAFQEDDWNTAHQGQPARMPIQAGGLGEFVKIGDCEFQVLEGCKRCVFTTIDPESLEKRKDQEPLRTLATYRKHPRGGVSFGVLLLPRKLGTIRLGDRVEVIP